MLEEGNGTTLKIRVSSSSVRPSRALNRRFGRRRQPRITLGQPDLEWRNELFEQVRLQWPTVHRLTGATMFGRPKSS